MAFGMPLLRMAKKLFLRTFKGLQVDKKTTFWDILGACLLGAILGALLAYGLLGGF